MKTILTLLFVIAFGAFAVAQDVRTDKKLNTNAIGVTLSYFDTKISVLPEIAVDTNKSIARILLFKKDKLKKELAFMTKKDKPKLV